MHLKSIISDLMMITSQLSRQSTYKSEKHVEFKRNNKRQNDMSKDFWASGQ